MEQLTWYYKQPQYPTYVDTSSEAEFVVPFGY